jgi:hypothetical protein
MKASLHLALAAGRAGDLGGGRPGVYVLRQAGGYPQILLCFPYVPFSRRRPKAYTPA